MVAFYFDSLDICFAVLCSFALIIWYCEVWWEVLLSWLLHVLYCSIDKVPKVTSPVLVIHGTEDEVIDFSHGLAIYERCPRAVEPLWVDVCIE
jgi:fermentation-respiration switch protein FrsA (DUF1100 family)